MTGRLDVAGSKAGTQSGYQAYGYPSDQVRVLIEGINTTEGTGGAGFYFDYASLEEAFLGTAGQSAEMPNPGVQSQFIARSGGNKFHGDYYLDWYNNSLQGSNIPSSYSAPTAFNNNPIRPGSNELLKYYDTNINVGGPVKQDKLWWFFTYKDQKNQVLHPNWQFDKSFDTRLWNPVTKWTYQLSSKNKLVGYYQWGQKAQPNRERFGTYTYPTPGETYKQDSGSWVYKAEWNGTISNRLYVEGRYGVFGYYFPLLANQDTGYYWRDSGAQTLLGTERRWQNDRERNQFTGAATYFIDTATKGSHSVKIGGEIFKEHQWVGFQQFVGGNIEHIYSNGVPSQVIFYIPTATDAGKLRLGKQGALLQLNNLDQQDLFVTDSWSWGRLTTNYGFRWDRYRSWIPEQSQLAATAGPVTVPARTFPEQTFFTWNSFAPRVGVIYDLAGNGRSVVKFNYGLYWHNPGPDIAGNANPNQATKSVTYAWSDPNRDKKWQPGEEGALLDSALAGAIKIDPDIKQPYTHEIDVFFERQLSEFIGSRIGFIYKTNDDLWQTYRPGRGLNAYTAPFPFVDIGVDGIRGTSDDRTLTLLGLPSALASQFPTDRVIMNTPEFGRYKTLEASVTRRFANRWSAQLGGGYTWTHDFPEGPQSYPNTPNDAFDYDRAGWGIKATGSYDAPHGIRFSPILRYQAGPNFARTISVPASAGTAFGLIVPATTYYADAADANRQDNITVIDLRTEKTINISTTKVRAFVDLFNITNSHAADTITRSTGANYLRPASLLTPFTVRIGFRFLW
jgi:hypothetical protein